MVVVVVVGDGVVVVGVGGGGTQDCCGGGGRGGWDWRPSNGCCNQLPARLPSRVPPCIQSSSTFPACPPAPAPPPRRSAGHITTWAGKGSDPDKTFADLLTAKAAADEARIEVARRFTEVGPRGGQK